MLLFFRVNKFNTITIFWVNKFNTIRSYETRVVESECCSFIRVYKFNTVGSYATRIVESECCSDDLQEGKFVFLPIVSLPMVNLILTYFLIKICSYLNNCPNSLQYYLGSRNVTFIWWTYTKPTWASTLEVHHVYIMNLYKTNLAVAQVPTWLLPTC